MELFFRNAEPTDLPWIIEVYNSTVPGKMVTADPKPVTVESRIAWFDEHEPSSRPLWIVHSAAENIGWVSFQSFYGRPAYRHTSEISLYLEESSRHKGLGKIILEKVIESCPALKIKTLIGFIFAQNEPSMRLFSTMGFSIWGHLPGIAEFEGEERDVNIVGKKIEQRDDSYRISGI